MNKLFIFFFCFFSPISFASEFRFESQHYISESNQKEHFNNYVFLHWNQDIRFSKGPFDFKVFGFVSYNIDKSHVLSYDLSEFSLSYRYSFSPEFPIKVIELNFGRTIKNWSLGDEYWAMALWNPLNRIHPLYPTSLGLTGSFLTLYFEKWLFDFFISGIYFPNKEAPLVHTDKGLYSPLRWVNSFPNQVDVFGLTSFDINYQTGQPYIFDLIFQESYIFSFKTWSKQLGTDYWLRGSFANKPVNHFFTILKGEEIFSLNKEKSFIEQSLDVLPVREQILSVEWGFKYKQSSAVFTLESTYQKEFNFKPQGWNFLNHRARFTYFSSLFKYEFQESGFIRLGYIQSWFSNYHIHFQDQKSVPANLGKYRILNGLSLEGEKEILSQTGLKRIFKIKYQYSFLNQAAWLSLRGLFYLKSDMYALLGADIIGAKDSELFFLNLFRHNDYVTWGLTYVF